MVSTLERCWAARELVKAMAFVVHADEARVFSACVCEFADELLRRIVERIALTTCEEDRWKAIRILEVDAAERMALVLIANKVRVEEHVAHPVGQGEAAVRALFGGSRA